MLRTLRESKGISISFVAETLGINRDTVKRLESGITEMRVDWLPKLSYLYGITKEELMKVEGGVSWGLWGIAGVIASFIMGFYEGVMNPVRCGK